MQDKHRPRMNSKTDTKNSSNISLYFIEERWMGTPSLSCIAEETINYPSIVLPLVNVVLWGFVFSRKIRSIVIVSEKFLVQNEDVNVQMSLLFFLLYISFISVCEFTAGHKPSILPEEVNPQTSPRQLMGSHGAAVFAHISSWNFRAVLLTLV